MRRTMKTFLSLALASIVTSSVAVAEPIKKVILKSEVEWTYLNPKRGDLAPSAGTLWGNRTGLEPTGFLVKFNEGFQSPPHIHNITYRAVVINGLVHNDDPKAEYMWMPQGSYWTQPKGEVHITAAKGTDSFAYLEIEKGPYLVLPKEKAFDEDERPINVDPSNIVWLDASNVSWVDQTGLAGVNNSPKIAFLWGKPEKGELNGTFIKLPAGFKGKVFSHGSLFRGVVVKGLPQYTMSESDIKTLEPGSMFSSDGASAVHSISSKVGEETVIYVRSNGKYDVISD